MQSNPKCMNISNWGPPHAKLLILVTILTKLPTDEKNVHSENLVDIHDTGIFQDLET